MRLSVLALVIVMLIALLIVYSDDTPPQGQYEPQQAPTSAQERDIALYLYHPTQYEVSQYTPEGY